jgi:hypothetical protein
MIDDPAKSIAAGSAHYGHERDSVPINFDPDLGPVQVLKATARRAIARETAEDMAEPHWLKVVLSVPDLLKRPAVTALLLGNYGNALHDQACEAVGVFDRTNWHAMLRTPQERLPHQALQRHTEHTLFLGREHGVRAVHVAFTHHEGKAQRELWRRVNLYASNPWSEWQEAGCKRMFGAGVTQCFEFPQCYLVNPYLYPILRDIVTSLAGRQLEGCSLKQIHVVPTPTSSSGASTEVELVGVTCESTRGSDVNTTFVRANQLFCSLGSSVQYRYVPIEPNTWASLRQHVWQAVRERCASRITGAHGLETGSQPVQYSRSLRGVGRHAANLVHSCVDHDDPNKLTMLATGLSITTMLSVPAAEAALVEHCDRLLRMAIGTTNSHWVLLDRTIAATPGGERVVYALRGTSGGAFPTNASSPGFLINNLANQQRVFGAAISRAVAAGRATLEFVEARDCSREVSSLNCFLMNKLCAGVALGYAYGGVGVVNGVPFGQLGRILASEEDPARLHALIRQKKGYSGGCAAMYDRPLFCGIDYSNMIACSAATTARRLGVDESLSGTETACAGSLAFGGGWAVVKTARFFRRRQPQCGHGLLGLGLVGALALISSPVWLGE